MVTSDSVTVAAFATLGSIIATPAPNKMPNCLLVIRPCLSNSCRSSSKLWSSHMFATLYNRLWLGPIGLVVCWNRATKCFTSLTRSVVTTDAALAVREHIDHLVDPDNAGFCLSTLAHPGNPISSGNRSCVIPSCKRCRRSSESLAQIIGNFGFWLDQGGRYD